MADRSWNQAKREVFSLQTLIFQRIEQGETLRHIWLELSRDEKISISLARFYVHVRTLQKNRGRYAQGSRPLKQPPPLSIAPSSKTASGTSSGPAVSPAQKDNYSTLFGQSTFTVNPHSSLLALKRAEDEPETCDRSKEPSPNAD